MTIIINAILRFHKRLQQPSDLIIIQDLEEERAVPLLNGDREIALDANLLAAVAARQKQHPVIRLHRAQMLDGHEFTGPA